jgi:hypothetical protein
MSLFFNWGIPTFALTCLAFANPFINVVLIVSDYSHRYLARIETQSCCKYISISE